MSDIPFDVYSAICTTKARYCRYLDEKDWQGFSDCFTEDLVLDTSHSGGEIVHGRDRILEWVRASLETAVTVHQVHVPDITLVDDNTADVAWAMQDIVIWGDERARQIGRKSLTGYGYYLERYVRCSDGRWRIASSKLKRLHIDSQPFVEPAGE
ncbi:MAG TPA: nuclear transport factor 2 family protein [Porticoccaceae bacterium]